MRPHRERRWPPEQIRIRRCPLQPRSATGKAQRLLCAQHGSTAAAPASRERTARWPTSRWRTGSVRGLALPSIHKSPPWHTRLRPTSAQRQCVDGMPLQQARPRRSPRTPPRSPMNRRIRRGHPRRRIHPRHLQRRWLGRPRLPQESPRDRREAIRSEEHGLPVLHRSMIR